MLNAILHVLYINIYRISHIFFERYAFIILTSILVPGKNYFYVELDLKMG